MLSTYPHLAFTGSELNQLFSSTFAHSNLLHPLKPAFKKFRVAIIWFRFYSGKLPLLQNTKRATMSNIFLSIDGVTGESDVIGHEKEIDILSWQWEMHQSSRGSSPTNRATVECIELIHEVDLASNGMMQMLLQNKIAPQAVISLRRPNAQANTNSLLGKVLPPPDFLKIYLKEVMIHRLEPYASAYGHYERIVLSFSEFKREYMTTNKGFPSGIASVSHRMHQG